MTTIYTVVCNECMFVSGYGNAIESIRYSFRASDAVQFRNLIAAKTVAEVLSDRYNLPITVKRLATA